MILSGLAFALMALFVKGSNSLPLMERVFFRNLVVLIIPLASWISKPNYSLWGRKGNRGLLLLRSLFGFLGVLGYFYAISQMNLADSSVLNKLSPFFVTFFAGLFLKEKITKKEVVALVLAFTGALFIIKPTWNYSMLPALSGFTSGLLAGVAYTIIRGLHNRNERSTVILFYFSLVSLLLSGLMMIKGFRVPDSSELISLLLIGVFAAGGQYFLTISYKFAEASKVSIYSYSNIVFSALFGFILWQEVPDTYSIIGGIIIVFAALWIFIVQKKK